MRKVLILLVPEGGIEPPPAQGRLDFESSASTSFTTPALALVLDYTGNLKSMSISYWHAMSPFAILNKKRGCSSAGRAHDWQSWGRRFDPVQLHQKIEGQPQWLPFLLFSFLEVWPSAYWFLNSGLRPPAFTFIPYIPFHYYTGQKKQNLFPKKYCIY